MQSANACWTVGAGKSIGWHAEARLYRSAGTALRLAMALEVQIKPAPAGNLTAANACLSSIREHHVPTIAHSFGGRARPKCQYEWLRVCLSPVMARSWYSPWNTAVGHVLFFCRSAARSLAQWIRYSSPAWLPRLPDAYAYRSSMPDVWNDYCDCVCGSRSATQRFSFSASRLRICDCAIFRRAVLLKSSSHGSLRFHDSAHTSWLARCVGCGRGAFRMGL
jgi:hypothetical protein